MTEKLNPKEELELQLSVIKSMAWREMLISSPNVLSQWEEQLEDTKRTLEGAEEMELADQLQQELLVIRLEVQVRNSQNITKEE